jgi:hypothetical protein
MTTNPKPVSAEELLAGMPDYIEIFRILRRAGRSDSAKAKAIRAVLEPIARALTNQETK